MTKWPPHNLTEATDGIAAEARSTDRSDRTRRRCVDAGGRGSPLVRLCNDRREAGIPRTDPVRLVADRAIRDPGRPSFRGPADTATAAVPTAAGALGTS